MNKHRITHVKPGWNQKGSYVLYWMQQAQRVHYNHALLHAIELANDHDLPIVVFFGLTTNYPFANLRNYQFMLEGLKEVKILLEKLHINFVFKLRSPELGVLDYINEASFLVMDKGYLKHQRDWRKYVIDAIDEKQLSLGVDIIDSDVIVPVSFVSDKVEYGAYTIRPKLTKVFRDFRDFKTLPSVSCKTQLNLKSDDDLNNFEVLLHQLPIDQSIQPSKIYHGGYVLASNTFQSFVMNQANHYNESNDPSKNLTSKMSMYLHFGQISSLELLDRLFLAQAHGHIQGESFDQYVEQLLVRRELAFNFVTYQEGYDHFDKMTETWAYQTMKAHENDFREHLYDIKDYQTSQTHDPYFNAAMIEMVKTGYMHNYMRMYWAKKIIEWSPNYQKAFDIIRTLNDTYFIDGRDPNSYAGIAWCFGKHDRAWREREIFGKLRYMNAKGLERKFDIKSYVSQMNTYL